MAFDVINDLRVSIIHLQGKALLLTTNVNSVYDHVTITSESGGTSNSSFNSCPPGTHKVPLQISVCMAKLTIQDNIL